MSYAQLHDAGDRVPRQCRVGARAAAALETALGLFKVQMESASWFSFYSSGSVAGNTRLARDSVGEEVSRLKEQPGKDIAVGGAGLARACMKLDLIDEWRLFVSPDFASVAVQSLGYERFVLVGLGFLGGSHASGRTAVPCPGRAGRGARAAEHSVAF